MIGEVCRLETPPSSLCRLFFIHVTVGLTNFHHAGIIYISRIPPHMVSNSWLACCTLYHGLAPPWTTPEAACCAVQKPQKLRHMLSVHGEVTRLYLAPEGDGPLTR